ncbi:MAG: homoserine kinase [Deltaproteobacteria bacterium]|nr:homoserine kinase [Deltaproteobacteria bacterium]
MSDEIVRVYAPASIGNVGPGFDVLGLCLESPGDRIFARRAEKGVRMTRLVPLDEKDCPAVVSVMPPMDARNTACVAATAVLERLGVDWGVELELYKGLPVGSGLGSSGASAVAAAVAVNELAGAPLRREELLFACAKAEGAACGAPHADNVAPALLGGFVLVRSNGSVTRIESPLSLWVAMVTPKAELPTREARAAIPTEIPLAEAVHNSAQLATMVYGLACGDLSLLQGAIDDHIAEPRRALMIPAFFEVKAAALQAGALGCSISGAGPSIFALCATEEMAQACEEAMSGALQEVPIAHRHWTSRVNTHGAQVDTRGEAT